MGVRIPLRVHLTMTEAESSSQDGDKTRFNISDLRGEEFVNFLLALKKKDNETIGKMIKEAQDKKQNLTKEDN